MKTLAELLEEAKNQPDVCTKPRTFLAIFPSGSYNGFFLDPFLGAISIKGIEGVIYARQIDLSKIQAIWID